ncbi:hypothetical protein Trydic_g21375 [Trypoxylus dichotomus]
MCSKTCFWIFLIIISYTGWVYTKKTAFTIGAIFHTSDDELQAIFNSAIDKLNPKYRRLPFTLKGVTIKHDGRNCLALSRNVCNSLARGVHAIIGPDSYSFSRHIGSICSRKDVPQILTRPYLPDEDHNYFTLNLHPHPVKLEQIFLDILEELDWKKFMIIYQNDDSLIKVGQLLSYKSSALTLNAIKHSGEEYFVVVCDLDTLKRFLQQAQQVGLLSEKHHYVIYNFDMSGVDVEQYQYGGCEIISVRFFDPANTEVMDTFNSLDTMIYLDHNIQIEGYTLNLETALLLDAVTLIHTIVTEHMPPDHITDQLLYCNNSDSWWHGTSFRNYMNVANVKGHTGIIRFDPEGYRSDFEVEIIELTTDGLIKIGTWNTTTGLKIQRPLIEDVIPEDDDSLVGEHFYVITVLTRPYGLMKDSTKQLYGNDRYEGFGIDIIHELSKILGFNYTIIVQEDGANGSKDEKTGKWSGMIGKVREMVADLAIGDLTITSERENAVDFTHPFMTLGISILYKKPEPVPPSLFMFTSPFSPQVWLFLGVAYVLVSLSLFVMGRLSPSEWQNPYPCIEEPEFLINQFTFKNSFWFTIGSLMQQGTELAPIGMSTRMLAGVWWFFTLIMVSSYTANLAAFLTVTTLETPFKNIEELAKQKEIKYGAKANGATAFFFRDSDRDDYRTIWKYMEKNPSVMVKENNEGVIRVQKENYAFLMESTSIEYVTERQCALDKVGGQLDEKGYGIAMRKGSTYRPLFNTAILKLQETGMLTTLRIKWWKEKLGGGTCQERSSAANVTPLDLKNVGGVFLVLGIGTFLGILMAFLELTMDVVGYMKHQNAKYRQEMKEEMRFFFEFKKNVKPVRRIGEQEGREDTVEFPFNSINYLENYINENNQNA